MNKNLLKEIPKINFKEENALVILSTQRSGSTMLCKDIESLKVLGTPDEHFWPVLQKDDSKSGEELLNYFISNGNLTNSNYYAVKLMYDYLHLFGFWVSDRKESLDDPNNIEKYREYGITFFKKMFNNVIYIYLRRENKFEQALSHYRAIKTNVFHIIDNVPIKSFYENYLSENEILDNIDINLFNRLYNRACNEDKALQELIDRLNIDYLPLVYEKIKNDYPNYLADIINRAGITIDLESLKNNGRKTVKIISNNFIEEFKKRLSQISSEQ